MAVGAAGRPATTQARCQARMVVAAAGRLAMTRARLQARMVGVAEVAARVGRAATTPETSPTPTAGADGPATRARVSLVRAPRWTTTSRASPDLAAARAAAVGSGAHARLSARPDLTRAPVPVAVLAPHPSRTAVRAHPPGAPHPSLRRWCRGGRERHRRPVRAPVVVARRWTRPDRARASGRRRSPARVHPSGRTDHLGHVDRWAPTAAQVRKTARGWPTAPAWRPGHAFPAGRDGQPAHVPAAVRMAQERVADRVAPEPAGPRCRVDQAFRADPACPADPA
ncbi:hypothetical protein GCM10022251_09580 [Phytohabitans flavus]